MGVDIAVKKMNEFDKITTSYETYWINCLRPMFIINSI